MSFRLLTYRQVAKIKAQAARYIEDNYLPPFELQLAFADAVLRFAPFRRELNERQAACPGGLQCNCLPPSQECRDACHAVNRLAESLESHRRLATLCAEEFFTRTQLARAAYRRRFAK